MSLLKKFGTAAVVMSAGFALLSGCGGDGDNFAADDVPGLSIEGWTSDSFLLDVDRVSQGNVLPSDSTVTLRSSDKATLKVTKLEWVARPGVGSDYRLAILGSADDTLGANGQQIPCDPADEAAACGVFPGSVCLTVTNATCRTTAVPKTPFEIESGRQKQIQFVLTRGSGDLNCPVAGKDVPEDYKERYCGELLIETNAENNSGIVKKGNVRLYFLTDDNKSGEMTISKGSLEFTRAKAGVEQREDFVVTNVSSKPLTIQQISINPTRGMLSISPMEAHGTSTVIAGGDSKTYTVTFNPPANTSAEDLEFSSTISFETSSIGNATNTVGIRVTADAGYNPEIVIDPLSLSFAEQNSQTITIKNFGLTVGRIQSLSVSPVAARKQYKVLYDGAVVYEDGKSQGLPLSVSKGTADEPSTIELEVQFVAPPADSGDSTIGTLSIGHNDAHAGNKTDVQLLGNTAELAMGQVLPNQYTFVAGTAGQEMEFVVYNRGTDPLEITDAELTGLTAVDAGLFTYTDVTGTIVAGGLLKGTAIYTGSATVDKRATLKLTSNTAGDAQDMTIEFVAKPAVTAVTLDLSIAPDFGSNAKVGDETTFTVSDASNTADLLGSNWLTLERPAGSTAFLSGTGASASFKPDVAGSYKVSVIVPNGDNITKQVSFSFNAVD